jgi:hypothetical protein
MPDVKISALPAASTPLSGTEVLPIVQSATTRQVSVANLTAGRAISASSVTNAALTSGRVTYAGASGLLQDSASFVFDGSNVGLGAAAGATTRLSVTAASGSLATFQQTGATSYGVTIVPGADTTYDAFTINNAANTLNKIRMFGNGNATFAGSVGIGTSSPAYTLAVNGTGVQIIGSGTASLYLADGTFQTSITSASNTIRFNGDTGTERMRIDSSGLVGIGTSSPSSYSIYGNKLVVYGTGTNGPGITIATGTADTGTLFFADGTTGTETYRGSVGYSHGDDALLFGTSAAERMRIDSSGNLLVGASSGTNIGGLSQKFSAFTSNNSQFVAGLLHTASSGTSYGLGISYTSQSPNTVGSDFINCGDNVGTRFAVYSNGGIANYSGNNVNLSDRREKTNFAPAKSYLDVICAIPVQTFNYIEQNLEQDAGLTLGVTAQDVQAVAPELVSEGNWGTKDKPKMRLQIYQTDIQYALMKALQELKAEFDAYKATHP